MEITTRNTNSAVAVLDLHGKLTVSSNSEVLDRTVHELIQLRAKRILLNVSDLTFLDCSGVGHLLRTRARIVQAGGSIALSGANYRVRHILELFRLGRLFNICDSDEAAIASFFPPKPVAPRGGVLS